MMKSLFIRFLSVASVLACAALHAAPGFRYEVRSVSTTDLGTLGGPHSYALDINDRGSIVGLSSSYAGVNHGFFYRDGIMIDVGVSAWSSASEATGVNNSDVVVGTLWEGAAGNQAFRWSSGVLTRLSHTRWHEFWWSGLMNSQASAISDSGLVVGARYADDLNGEAIVWTDVSSFYRLAVDQYGVGSYLRDINSGGQVIGRDGSISGNRRWQFTPATSPNLGEYIPPIFSGGPHATPLGINRWGAVVGYAGCSAAPGGGCLRALRWDGTSSFSRDLGVLPTGARSVAEDINDSGFIVGFADRLFPGGLSYPIYTGFIYHPDFGMFELPKLPTTLPDGVCHAIALNNIDSSNLVRVVGDCKTGGRSSSTHAVRWDVTLRKRTPLCPTPSPC